MILCNIFLVLRIYSISFEAQWEGRQGPIGSRVGTAEKRRVVDSFGGAVICRDRLAVCFARRIEREKTHRELIVFPQCDEL